MAEKNQNEILAEQRKAREEFLKLKKMQSGEIDAGPKPSEIAIVPKTAEEKRKNFWFHYKWHTLATIFIVVVMTVLIAQCATKPKYDLEVVYFTYTPVLDFQLEGASNYFEEFVPDLNDDGDVKVNVLNCSLSDKSVDVQYRNTVLTKLQAMLVSDEKAMLFITDPKSIKYFDAICKDGSFFVGEPLALGEDFYEATKTEEYGSLPEGLTLSCRILGETLLNEKKGAEEMYKASLEVIEKIKTINK